MGRSGGGGSHGGGSSHSSHSSSSHSHSSHSVSRSYSGSSGRSYHSGGGRNYRPSSNSPPRTYHNYGGYRPVYYGGYSRPGCSFSTLLVIVVLIVVIGLASGLARSFGSAPVSTTNRERLDAGSFTEDCVVNDIGWVFDEGFNEHALGSDLQVFWEKTGIQPYIYLLPENDAWVTGDERFDKADNIWMHDLGSREDVLLLVYFDAEPDGNFEMVKGHLAGGVMDSEAEDIFWSYLDRYWADTENYSVQSALLQTFKSTGERIMTKTTTGMDILKYVVIGIVILVAAFMVIKIMRIRRRHAAEAAAETERILSTPLDMSGSDSLADKYSDPPGDSP